MKYLLLIIAGFIAVFIAGFILLILTFRGGSRRKTAGRSKYSKKTATIVLVTYNDSLEFMNSVKQNSIMTDLDTSVTLYNKNKSIPVVWSKQFPDWPAEERSLENFGMDIYGYIVHIVENYNNLPYVLFIINGGTDRSQPKRSKLAYLLNHWQLVYSKGFVDTDPAPAMSDFYLDEWETTNPLNRNPSHSKLTPALVRPFKKWYEAFVGPWIHVETSGVSYTNIFAVRRDRVLQHSINLYAQLKYQLEIGGVQSEVAHYIERTFVSLFSKDWK